MKTNQHSDPHMPGGKAGWFILGAFAGAAVALLASPASGKENRQVLGRRARQVGDYVMKEGSAFVESQRHLVADAVERGRSEVVALGTRVNEAMTQGRTAYRAARTQFQASAPIDGASRAIEGSDARLG
jgi:gas vesicle protein